MGELRPREVLHLPSIMDPVSSTGALGSQPGFGAYVLNDCAVGFPAASCAHPSLTLRTKRGYRQLQLVMQLLSSMYCVLGTVLIILIQSHPKNPGRKAL